MYTLNFTNNIEKFTCTYYSYSWANICDFKRQMERDYEEWEWIEGEDFTVEYGEYVEIDSDDLEIVQPGIYTDAA